MAEIVIKNIDGAVIERLHAMARARGKSLEELLRDILMGAARSSRNELIEELAQIRAMGPPWRPEMPLAEDLIREGRDKR